jgi:hypothetical protein
MHLRFCYPRRSQPLSITRRLDQHLGCHKREEGRVETAEPPVARQIGKPAPKRTGNGQRGAQHRRHGPQRRLSQSDQAQGDKRGPVPNPVVHIPVGQMSGQHAPPLAVLYGGPVILAHTREHGTEHGNQRKQRQSSHQQMGAPGEPRSARS